MTLFVADISSAQKGLTIAELKDAGIVAVVIKATEGAGYRNPLFAGWLAEAQALGMLTAAYHFMHPVSQISAAAQAANILSVVPHDVPVFLDDEAGATLADGQAVADLLVAAHETLAGQYNWARPRAGCWWRAAYLSDPHGSAGHAYQQLGGDRAAEWAHGEDLWQFCQHGDVPGFSGDVDFSAFRGTLAQLEASGWFWTPTTKHQQEDDMAQLRIHQPDGAIYWINGSDVRHVSTMDEARALAAEVGADIDHLQPISGLALGYYTAQPFDVSAFVAAVTAPLAKAVAADLPGSPAGTLTEGDVEAAVRAVLHNA